MTFRRTLRRGSSTRACLAGALRPADSTAARAPRRPEKAAGSFWAHRPPASSRDSLTPLGSTRRSTPARRRGARPPASTTQLSRRRSRFCGASVTDRAPESHLPPAVNTREPPSRRQPPPNLARKREPRAKTAMTYFKPKNLAKALMLGGIDDNGRSHDLGQRRQRADVGDRDAHACPQNTGSWSSEPPSSR